MDSRWLNAVAGALGALLVACGGGGGDSGGNTPPPPAAPVITYGASSFTLPTHSPVTLTPTNSGGAATSWSVSDGLPAGLALSTTTGVISGTVTNALAPATVTVTATNAGGSGTVTLAIGTDAVLLNLGALDVGAVALSTANVVTEDGAGTEHWVLWNYASGALIAQGDACPPDKCSISDVGAMLRVGVAGPIAVVPYTAQALQVLSSASGAVISTIKGNFGTFQVAPDASYICTVDGNVLTAWGQDGTTIVSHPGNYLQSAVSCVAGEMRVANGPAGATVIERVAVPGGQVTVSPQFAGAFSSWAADGSAFLTSVGNTVWVYSPAGQLLDTQTLGTTANLGGTSQWFWTFDGTDLNVYKVGASSIPTAVYTVTPNALNTTYFAASGPVLTLWDSATHIIDLSGATPVETSYPATPPYTGSVFAAVSATQWVVGSTQGTLLDGATVANAAPRYFGYGSVLSMAGTPSRLAVATASGQTLIYDTSNWSLVTTLRAGLFSKIQLSDDGTVLAALSATTFSSSAGQVQTLSLPAGSVINTWNNDASDITLSASASLLGQVIPATGLVAPSRQVTAVTGGAVLWSDSGADSPIFLSADDSVIVVSTTLNNMPVTNVYRNDALATQLPGNTVGWLANDNILQATGGQDVAYALTGAPLGGPALPSLAGPTQVVTSDLFFDAGSNSIYSLSSGVKTWSVVATRSVLAGSRVAYVVGSQLATQPY